MRFVDGAEVFQDERGEIPGVPCGEEGAQNLRIGHDRGCERYPGNVAELASCSGCARREKLFGNGLAHIRRSCQCGDLVRA